MVHPTFSTSYMPPPSRVQHEAEALLLSQLPAALRVVQPVMVAKQEEDLAKVQECFVKLKASAKGALAFHKDAASRLASELHTAMTMVSNSLPYGAVSSAHGICLSCM